MTPDHILHAEILDIIFEKKNKDYGAYPLRKYYHERLYRSLGIIFLGALVLSVAAYFYKNKPQMAIAIPEIWYVKPIEMSTADIKAPERSKSLQKKSVASGSKASVAEQVPIIASISSTVEAPIEPANVGAGKEGPELPTTTGAEAGEKVKMPLISNVIRDPSIPLVAAEIMPSFPGGIDALRKFLERNLISPVEMQPGESVSVRIQFIVGFDGALKGFQVLEDGGALFNNEVIRVLKKMPAWIPGKTKGENVSVFYSVPVIFSPQF